MEARVRRSTLGDRADYNATHVPPDEGKSFWLATDLHTFKVVGEDANGAFALEELTAYTQFAPPPHIHHREDESCRRSRGSWRRRRGTASRCHLLPGSEHL
jgi:hypothetical protein